MLLPEAHLFSRKVARCLISIFLILSLLLQASPTPARAASVQAVIRLSGLFSLLWGDAVPGSGLSPQFYAALDTADGQRVQLQLGDNLPAPFDQLLKWRGQQVDVTGDWVPSGNPLDLMPQSIQLSSGVSESDLTSQAVTGTKRYVSVMCKFKDIATEPANLAFFQNMYASTFPGLDYYWREVSYDNINVGGSGAYGWYTLPQNRSYYVTASGANLNQLAVDCTHAADGDINYSTVFGMNLMFNSDLDGYAWGGGGPTMTLDGVTKWWPTTWEPPWGYADITVISHEMGHSFGMPHSSFNRTNVYDNHWDVMSDTWSDCLNLSDATYGCLGQDTISYHLNLVGWIPTERRITINPGSASTITLERTDLAGSSDYLMAIVPIAGSATNYYTVEARKKGGFDVKLPGEAVIIHQVTTSNGIPAVVVGSDGGTGAMWTAGETFSGLSSISVTVNSSTASGFSVTINNNATTLPTTPATPSPADNATLARTSNTTLSWSTTGTSCSVHVWGGSIDTSASGGCASLALGVQHGGAYQWQVTATNTVGSTLGPIWDFNVRPAAPGGLSSTGATSSQITLNWTLSGDDPGDVDGYDIYQNGGLTASVDPGVSTYTAAGLTCGTPYAYTVVARRQAVLSDPTSTITPSTVVCAPGVFSKTIPSSAAVGVSLTPSLSWGASSSAASYEYCLNSSGSPCAAWTTTGTNTSAAITSALNPGAVYYWQVRARNTSDTVEANGGTWWSFTTLTLPAAFTKSAPASAATGVSLTPTLTWGSSTGAASYEYCLNSSGSPCAAWTTTGTNTSAAISTALNPGAVYYWQVRARNPSGTLEANSAAWWSFTTLALPGTFAKSGPANSATGVSLTPTLSWGSSTGAASYEYCLNSSGSPCAAWTTTGTNTSIAISTALNPGAVYYWQVRARNTSGTVEANSAAWWSFTTLALPAAFNKSAPASAATGVSLTPTLSWGSSTGAASYEYCLNSSGSPCAAWTTTGTNTSIAISTALNPGTVYYWQVRARNLSGTVEANGAAWWSFTTLALPAAFNKSTPANAATGVSLTPTLSWGSSTGAASYEYCLNSSGSPCAAWTTTGTNTSAAITSALNPGAVYYWQVRARNTSDTVEANGGTWWSFTTLTLPAAFTKSAPASAATGVSLTPTLTWGSSTGAASYEYCLNSSGSPCAVWTTTGTDTSIAISTALNPGAVYYWQVRARNPSGTVEANSAAWWSFTTLALPGTFAKSAPASSATGVSLTPNLSWGASTGAASYEYCLNSSGSPCAAWTTTGTSTSAAISTALNPGAVYYWQVRARNPSGTVEANGATWWSFTTLALPGTFAKSAPANAAAGVSRTPTLSWGASSDAASYEYCLNPGGSPCAAWVTVGTDRSLSPAGLAYSTTYHWQVRARDASGTTEADGAAWWTFTTQQAPPAAFNKLSPADSSTRQSTSLTLSWQGSLRAGSYEYCLNQTGSACSPGGWVSTSASTSVTLPALQPGATYYWQVRAINFTETVEAGGGWWSFATLPLPGDFARSSPLDTAVRVPVGTGLTWSASSNAASYEYCLNTSASPCDAPAWVSTGSGLSAVLPAPLIHNTTYYWQVRARNPSGVTSAGDWWTFTTLALPGAFEKTAPVDAAVDLPLGLSLTWSASSEAATYEYCLNTSGSPCSAWITGLVETSVTPPGLVKGATYYWQVRARNTSGVTEAGSGWWHFGLMPDPPGAFSKTAPLNAASAQALPIQLKWGASSRADSYEYCMDTVNNNLCDSTWLPAYTSLSATPSGLAYHTTYYWQVRAANAAGSVEADAGTWWSFTQQDSPVPSKPALLTPASNALLTDYTPVLDWSDSSALLDHYNVQVATASTFTLAALIFEQSVSASTVELPTALEPGHTYYWRVQAVNDQGITLGWTTSRYFRTGWLPPDLLVNPALNTTPDTRRPQFSWSPVTGATSYTLQVSRYATFSSMQVNTTSIPASYTPSADLTANLLYYWRVRTNGSNGPSAWSVVGRFSSPNPPSIPTLSAPAANALLVNNTPTLDWSNSTVPTGTFFDHYRLQVSVSSTFTPLLLDKVDLTPAANSQFAMVDALPANATYYWRVNACNTLGQCSAWSAVRSLRTPLPTPVLLTPAAGEIVTSTRPSFDWEDVPGAASYSFQISSTTSFSTTKVSASAAGSSYTVTTDLTRAVTLYWRVRANGVNTSQWSAPRVFTSANPPTIPTLALPVNKVLLTTLTPTLDWSNSTVPAGTVFGHYLVELSPTSAFAAVTDYEVGAVPADSQYVFTAPLAPGATFYWRVKAFNAAGQVSLWSSVRNFRTP